jgi:hypothetical protein
LLAVAVRSQQAREPEPPASWMRVTPSWFLLTVSKELESIGGCCGEEGGESEGDEVHDGLSDLITV